MNQDQKNIQVLFFGAGMFSFFLLFFLKDPDLQTYRKRGLPYFNIRIKRCRTSLN